MYNISGCAVTFTREVYTNSWKRQVVSVVLWLLAMELAIHPKTKTLNANRGMELPVKLCSTASCAETKSIMQPQRVSTLENFISRYELRIRSYRAPDKLNLSYVRHFIRSNKLWLGSPRPAIYCVYRPCQQRVFAAAASPPTYLQPDHTHALRVRFCMHTCRNQDLSRNVYFSTIDTRKREHQPQTNSA